MVGIVGIPKILEEGTWTKKFERKDMSFFFTNNRHLENSHYYKNGIYIIIKGQIYFSRIVETPHNSISQICDTIYSIYFEQKWDKLKEFDGTFSISLFDTINQKLVLISDRFGQSPLYYYKSKGFIVWSNELKGVVENIANNRLSINKSAIKDFIHSGQLIDDKTWYNEIKLLNASTYLEFSVDNGKIVSDRYWSWSAIEKKSLDKNDIIHTIITKLTNSIIKRTAGIKTVGILLSGGKDSNLILALNKNIQSAFTFGCLNDFDLQSAQLVTQASGINHYPLIVNKNNWIEGKVEAIWNVDCGISIIHFHFSPFLNYIKNRCDYLLNGIPGELNLGGKFIRNLNSRISINSAHINPYDGQVYLEESLPFINSRFYDFNSEDIFFLDSRVRRFTMYGLHYMDKLNHITPFMDNDLNEFLYSLDDSIRYQNSIYLEVINEIGITNLEYKKIELLKFSKRGKILLRSIANYWFSKLYRPQNYQEIFFKNFLKHHKILKDFIHVKEMLSCINKNESSFKHLARLFSIEVYLQQTFQNKYKSTEEILPFYYG